MQIVFHIGQPKTASTLIQIGLKQNQQQLAAQGTLYPSWTKKDKTDWILRHGRPVIGVDMHTEFSKPYERAILSDETFYNFAADRLLHQSPRAEDLKEEVISQGVITYLRHTFSRYATSWRVLCYLRRPDEHIASQYQQRVKVGYAGTLTQFYNERLNLSYYHYAHLMDEWGQAFGQDAVEVRVFHRSVLDGTPFEDFVRWLGLPPENFPLKGEAIANESWDQLNTEVIRFMNRCALEWPDVWLPRDPRINRDLVTARMLALDTGERLRLAPEQAKRLHEELRNDHERLAARYLSLEHAALFLAPPPEAPTPPLDREALHARVMAVLESPDLANLAAETADQAADQLKRPKGHSLWRGTRDEGAARRAAKRLDRNS